MPRRPAVILLVALLAALLLAPIVLLALAGPAGDAEAPASLMATPTSVPASSAQASSTPPPDGIAFTDALIPEDAAWYRIGDDPREGPTHVQVGTVVDGVTYEAPMQVDLGVNPDRIVPFRPVLGVGDGVVVLVDDDGRDSTMRAVVGATGAIHDLLVSDDVIVNGLLSGDGRMAYYLTADRLTGDVIGAWRLDIESGGAPQPMGTLIGAAPEFRHAAVSRHFTRMLLSPDGSTLALFRCVELDCVLRAVGTDDGSLVGEVRIPRGGNDPFAITDRLALLRPIVQDGPHAVGEVIDLASGASQPMPVPGPQTGTVAAVQGADGAVMAVQTAGFSGPPQTAGGAGVPPEVTLVDLADMTVLAEFSPPLSSLTILDLDDRSVGVDLPAGWILLRAGTPAADAISMYAMRVEDGELVTLPGVDDHAIQD
jgi:hypothetical protein